MFFNKHNIIIVCLVIAIAIPNILLRSQKCNANLYNDVIIKVAAVSYNPPNVVEIGKHNFIGSDVEILKEITKRTGIKFKIDAMGIAEALASISVNKHQMTLGCYAKTPARSEQVDFSRSLYKKEQDALVKITSYNGYSKLSQLANKKIACVRGTLQYDAIMNYNKTARNQNKIKMNVVDDETVAMQFLQHNKVDAVISHSNVAKNYKKLADKKIVTEACQDIKRTDEQGCHILFSKKMQRDLKDIINTEINKLIDDGTADKWYIEQEEKYNQYVNNKQNKEKYKKALLSILEGLPAVLHITLCSVLLGTMMAILLVCLRYSKIKILNFLSKSYITIVRGLPVLLQMSFIFFILPTILKIEIPIITAGIISLSLCCSAYIAEVIRSGINSIDKGQYETCKSLNMTKFQTIKDVIAPQVFINSLPAMINTIISLVKETSLLSTFGAYEIMKRANLVIADYYTYFVPLTIAGVAYLILTFSLEKLSEWCEKRKKY